MPEFRTIKPTTRFPHIEAPSKKKVFPKFRIDLKHLPEGRKWKVGKKYFIGLHVKQIGLMDTDFEKSVEFDIIGIKAKDNPKKTNSHKKSNY